MKKCKSCQSLIDDKAKKCPKCQADQRNWFAKHPVITVILAIVLISMISSGGNKNNNNNNNNSPTQKEEQKNYEIGESINTGNIEITTVSVKERSRVGDSYFNENASEGATLIAVYYKYKNIGEKPVGSFHQPTIKLVDPNGTEYNWDLGKSSTYAVEQKIDSKIISDLNPGITVTDAKVFEISKESYSVDGWKLKFTVGGKLYMVKI